MAGVLSQRIAASPFFPILNHGCDKIDSQTDSMGRKNQSARKSDPESRANGGAPERAAGMVAGGSREEVRWLRQRNGAFSLRGLEQKTPGIVLKGLLDLSILLEVLPGAHFHPVIVLPSGK